MRLTRALPALALAAACAPHEERTATTPPVVASPKSGAILDRCVVRVRMDMPETNGSVSSDPRNVEMEGHADWKLNGGPSNEVATGTFDRDFATPFIFGVSLVAGANHLEVGRCDSVDFCGWTPVDVTVTQRPGAPDCAFLGGGQAILKDAANAHRLTPLEGGRMMLGLDTTEGGPASSAVVMLKADGSRDVTFGTRGLVRIPAQGQDLLPVRLADGSVRVFVGGIWMAKISAPGVFDASFGEAGIGGLHPIPFPSPGGARIGAAVLGASGEILVAGNAWQDAQKPFDARPFVASVAPDGTVTKFTLLDDHGLFPSSAFAIRPDGSAAFASADRVIRGSLDGGLDTSFGLGGHAETPLSSFTGVPFHGGTDVAFTANGLVVAQQLQASPSDVLVRTYDAKGAFTELLVPFRTSLDGAMEPEVHLAVAADGTVWIAGSGPHAADPAHAWKDDPGGSDFALARLRDGALDTSWGTQGIAHVDFMDAWQPAATDSLNEAPRALALGEDGRPWMVGLSTSNPNATADLFTRRGPGVALVKLLP